MKVTDVDLDLTKRLKDDEFAREYVAMVEGDAKKQSERNRQLEAALVALIDAVDARDGKAIDHALFVGRGLTF